jgi:hypothetical protein
MIKATFTLESLQDLLGFNHHELNIKEVRTTSDGLVEFEFVEPTPHDATTEICFNFSQLALISAVLSK